jgi:hypothetical protein
MVLTPSAAAQPRCRLTVARWELCPFRLCLMVPSQGQPQRTTQDLLAERWSATQDQLGDLGPEVPELRFGELTSVPSGDDKETGEVDQMGGPQLRRSPAGNIQVSNTGIGFFAIPIMVLAGTPAGPPSAPRRHVAHQVRGIARQRGPRGQGPG